MIPGNLTSLSPFDESKFISLSLLIPTRSFLFLSRTSASFYIDSIKDLVSLVYFFSWNKVSLRSLDRLLFGNEDLPKCEYVVWIMLSLDLQLLPVWPTKIKKRFTFIELFVTWRSPLNVFVSPHRLSPQSWVSHLDVWSTILRIHFDFMRK